MHVKFVVGSLRQNLNASEAPVFKQFTGLVGKHVPTAHLLLDGSESLHCLFCAVRRERLSSGLHCHILKDLVSRAKVAAVIGTDRINSDFHALRGLDDLLQSAFAGIVVAIAEHNQNASCRLAFVFIDKFAAGFAEGIEQCGSTIGP